MNKNLIAVLVIVGIIIVSGIWWSKHSMEAAKAQAAESLVVPTPAPAASAPASAPTADAKAPAAEVKPEPKK